VLYCANNVLRVNFRVSYRCFLVFFVNFFYAFIFSFENVVIISLRRCSVFFCDCSRRFFVL
jgi:hypothetical protein